MSEKSEKKPELSFAVIPETVFDVDESMNCERIDYPISVEGYVKNWCIMEVMREIISNSLDTKSNFNVIVDKESKIVSVIDFGDGFTRAELILGNTQKNGVTHIGQFGEGMKLALLVALRLGLKVLIRTSDLVIKPEIFQIEGVECLRLMTFDSQHIKGTKFFLQYNTEVDYLLVMAGIHQFVHFSTVKVIYRDEEKGDVLVDEDLFINDVRIGLMGVNQIFGYNLKNLKLNRDRNVVKLTNVLDILDDLLSDITNKRIIQRLLSKASETTLESNCPLTFDESVFSIWKKMFGRKAIISTDSGYEQQLEYWGYNCVKVPSKWVYGLERIGIKTDYTVHKEHNQEIIKSYSYRNEYMTTIQRKNLSSATKMIYKSAILKYGYDGSLEQFKKQIRIFKKTKLHKFGFCENQIAYVEFQELNSLRTTIRTLTHEVCHSLSGMSDGAKFAVELGDFMSYVIDNLHSTYIRKETEEK